MIKRHLLSILLVANSGCSTKDHNDKKALEADNEQLHERVQNLDANWAAANQAAANSAKERDQAAADKAAVQAKADKLAADLASSQSAAAGLKTEVTTAQKERERVAAELKAKADADAAALVAAVNNTKESERAAHQQALDETKKELAAKAAADQAAAVKAKADADAKTLEEQLKAKDAANEEALKNAVPTIGALLDKAEKDKAAALDEKAKALKNMLTSALAPYDGIWISDLEEPLPVLGADCHMITNVKSADAQIIRAIICANGNLEATQLNVTAVGQEPSETFTGHIQYSTQATAGASSCSAAQAPTALATGSLAFDLNTSLGGLASDQAYTKLGGEPVVLVNGQSLSELQRKNDCASLLANAGTDQKSIAWMAARVCKLPGEPDPKGGCFVTGGTFAMPSPGT